MSNARDDYLKECMSEVPQAPLDEFQKAYCLVCANRECSRSRMNNSVFDKRVANWKENLFIHPPQAAADDPRFDNFRSKQFLPLVKDGSREVRSVDVPVIQPPKFMPGAAEAPPPEPKETAPTPPDSPPPDLVPQPQPPPDLPAAEQEPTPEAQPAQQGPAFGNTSFQQGTVLPGGPGGQEMPADKTFVLGDD